MNFDVSFCNSCSGQMMKVAFQVSQGSVATLMCGKNMKSFHCKFLAETMDERTLKIGHHLPKLWTNKKYVLWNMVSAPQPSSQVHGWTVRTLVTSIRLMKEFWRFGQKWGPYCIFFHCAGAKRPYFYFRSKIWRHHRVPRPRVPNY